LWGGSPYPPNLYQPYFNDNHRNVVVEHKQFIDVPQTIAAIVKLCYTPAVGWDIANKN
jgi:hypothetical protein